MNEPIDIKFVHPPIHKRWHCTVCGGWTEKVPVLSEGEFITQAGHSFRVRVCEKCLKAGDIDVRLEEHALVMEVYLAGVREQIGRLKMPSYADWEAACDAAEAELNAEYWAE